MRQIPWQNRIKSHILSTADLKAETDKEKQTPLHFAARNDAVEACKVLVKCGADIEAKDYRKRTPVYVAAELGIFEKFHCLRFCPAFTRDARHVTNPFICLRLGLALSIAARMLRIYCADQNSNTIPLCGIYWTEVRMSTRSMPAMHALVESVTSGFTASTTVSITLALPI